MVTSIWLSGLVAGFAGAVSGQTADLALMDRSDIVVTGQALPRTVTATKTDTSLTETPQSITIVTSDRYLAQGALTLSDTLRYTAGVRAEAYGLDARSDDAFVRGTSILTYQDGLRRTFAGYRSGPKADVFLLDRVEILRGPSSMLFGQGSTGGLLNTASKMPSFTPAGRIFGSYGTFDRKEFGIDLTGGISGDTLAARLVGVWRDADTQVRRVGERRYAVSPSLTWRPDANTQLTLIALVQNDDTGWTTQFLPYAVTLRANANGRIPRSAQLGEPSIDKVDFDTKTITALFRHRFSDALKFSANARHEWFRSDQALSYADAYGTPTDPFVDPLDPYLNRYFPKLAKAGAGRILNRFAYAEHFTSRVLTTDANLQADFRTGTLTHTVLAGVDYARYRGSLATGNGYSNNGFDIDGNPVAPTATPIDVFDPVYGNVIALPLSAPAVARETQVGVYVQDQIKAFDRATIVLGLRRDRAEGRGDGLATQVDHAWTTRIGLMVEIVPGVTPYASYSESFRPVAGTDINGVAYRPTRGRQYETGVKWQPDARSLVTAAMYDLKDSGRLATDPANPLNSVQAGTVKTRGMEIEASRTIGSSFDLIATYSYTRAHDGAIDVRDRITTDQFESIPKHLASLWAMKAIDLARDRRLRLGGGARYISNSYSSSFERDGTPFTLVTPDYVAFDALVGLDAGRWQASLNATNVLDKRYFTTCVGSGDCFVGLRRTVNLKLGFRY